METPTGQLEDLMRATLDELDITPEAHLLATGLYQDVGTWLSDHGATKGGGDWDISPQGSFYLGTVVRPLNRSADYDIDLVCRRGIQKTSITQADLKAGVGEALRDWAESAKAGTSLGVKLDEWDRCWTLTFGTRFHMDVLPAIPNQADPPDGIEITDREVRLWLPSNPKQFAKWFQDQMSQEFAAVRSKMASQRAVTASIEQIPEWEVRTTLQRSVQVLKRHRDIYFNDRVAEPDAAPPSIILTTLAAHCYAGAENLVDAVQRMAVTMGEHIEFVDRQPFVRNPVQPEENFADSWVANPDRLDAFRVWLTCLHEDLSELLETRGLHLVTKRLSTSFGDKAVTAALGRTADDAREAREAGNLKFDASASLGVTGVAAVKSHSFFGES